MCSYHVKSSNARRIIEETTSDQSFIWKKKRNEKQRTCTYVLYASSW